MKRYFEIRRYFKFVLDYSAAKEGKQKGSVTKLCLDLDSYSPHSFSSFSQLTTCMYKVGNIG